MAVHSRPTVLLTRPRPASERFAEGLAGLDVVIAPLMELVGTDTRIDLDGIAGLVLTSEAAVAHVPGTALPAYCVGPRTTQAAHAAGLTATQIGVDADSLVAGLLAARPDAPLLHIQGRHQRGIVAERLTLGGLPTRAVIAYDQRALAPEAEFRRAIVRDSLLVPLFSPRSAALFAAAAEGLHPGARMVAISDAAAAALPPDLRARTIVIAEPNGPEMARALQAAALRRNSP